MGPACAGCPAKGVLGGRLEISPSFTHQVMLWHKPRGRDTFGLLCSEGTALC